MTIDPCSPVLTRSDDVVAECRMELDVARASIDHIDRVLAGLGTELALARRTGIAIGMLMERLGATEDEAVALLSAERARASLLVADSAAG